MKVGKESVLWISGMEFQKWGEEKLTALNPVVVKRGEGTERWRRRPEHAMCRSLPHYTENADRCVHITCIMHTFPHYHAGDPVRCTPFLAQYRITSMQSHTRTLIQSESLLFHRVYLLHSQKHWLSYSLIHMVMFSFKMTLPRLTNQQILPLSCCLM